MNSSNKLKDKREVEVGPRWYVVNTKPNQETKAKLNLEYQGFKTYLPMRLCSPTSKRPITPFLPRYLFVSIDPTVQAWRSIFSTHGVHNLITSGDNPAFVPDRFIDELRSREIEGSLQLKTDAAPKPFPFKPGDKVRIKVDPFMGVNAMFERRLDADRITILLSILGRDSRVDLHITSVLEADMR
jgi:transcriptional antiterminator RfaH